MQRTQQPEYSVRINAQIANTLIPQLRSIAEELGMGSTLTGSDLMRVPDFLQVEAVDAEVSDEERDALAAIVREAFEQMRTMVETKKTTATKKKTKTKTNGSAHATRASSTASAPPAARR